MTISIVDGRWDFSGLGNLPTEIDVFINSHRVVKPQRQRGKISKEHNYKFKPQRQRGKISKEHNYKFKSRESE